MCVKLRARVRAACRLEAGVPQSTWARQHGDANMLVLGADVTDAETAELMLSTFLSTSALGDRYAARRERLVQLDISEI